MNFYYTARLETDGRIPLFSPLLFSLHFRKMKRRNKISYRGDKKKEKKGKSRLIFFTQWRERAYTVATLE